MQIQTANYATLVELLYDRAQSQPNKTAFTFLKDGETQAINLTYQELEQQAKAIALQLKVLKIKQGDRAVLVYPYDGALEFIAAFFGCLYAGVVAVPCYPPQNSLALRDLQSRLFSCQAQIILTSKSLLAKLKNQLITPGADSIFNKLHWLATDDVEKLHETSLLDWVKPNCDRDTLAFLQYTSGSTGIPKGVMVTHACILHNQKMLQMAFGHTEEASGVGWLPLFHDMGLIGTVIQAVYLGSPCIFMSPIAFIQKPIRWLEAISRYKATTSGAPNFAYDLLSRRATPAQVANLDLSRWTVAFCGAEPIRVETLDRFAEKFAPCGFRREAFYPCYGMAEATLFVTGGIHTEPPVVKYVEKAPLEKNRVVITNREKQGVREILGCGRAWLDSKIIIVDPESLTQCPSDRVGEIWVSGMGVGKGYWNLPEQTERTFCAYLKDTGEGPFLRTGDLGFMQDGELFVTGRLNDLMVFWGFNHYPQQIEETVEKCHPALRPGCGAAFAVEVAGENRLVIAHEIERSYRQGLVIDEVVEAIRWAIFQEHLIDVYAIVVLKTGSLPKTSSGKVQRKACQAKFLEGSLDVVGEWRLEEQSDINSSIERYLNPMTHLRRYSLLFGGRLRRFLYLWVNGKKTKIK
ncbi:acyl-CoA synthetase (AMP-forming)/AMP-acid ligase II [Pleurocapsa sp. PCC 7327]|uniref:fatty acyl-AMP ligase n=1 Tax=Pleurocapsa sp. PCC 7327 TaxID=118163 RepID=UPI00029FA222|nr:fatty acyl-AMP ligase [Pleurocapsa sp. PCC 7327]AFY78523.1 acyl-CoA synthetase (AMP-forming)/AMP-acid ligase II [Pleurocapsa sp. PCC 7327]